MLLPLDYLGFPGIWKENMAFIQFEHPSTATYGTICPGKKTKKLKLKVFGLLVRNGGMDVGILAFLAVLSAAVEFNENTRRSQVTQRRPAPNKLPRICATKFTKP